MRVTGRTLTPSSNMAAIKDDKFYEQVQDVLLFEKLDGTFWVLQELRDYAKEHGGRAFYVSDPKAQGFYIDLLKEQGEEAILLSGPVDDAFVGFLEYKCEGLSLLRIDADIAQSLKGQYENLPEKEPLEKLMRKVSGNEKLEVEVEPLKSSELLSMFVINEEMRRFSDMAARYGGGFAAPSPEGKLVLNGSSRLSPNWRIWRRRRLKLWPPMSTTWRCWRRAIWTKTARGSFSKTPPRCSP